jgi:hypothetical protein
MIWFIEGLWQSWPVRCPSPRHRTVILPSGPSLPGCTARQPLRRPNASNDPRYRLLEATSRPAPSSAPTRTTKYVGGQHDNEYQAVYW